MSTAIQFRRGSTVNHSSFAGLLGELTVDTTKKVVVVHDGSTLGGTPMSPEGHTHTASEVSNLKYQTIQIAGSAQTQQPIINLSSLFSASNDTPNTRTTVTLANNNTSGSGTYGTATRVPVVVVNDQGLITSISETNITGVPPAGTASGDLGGSYPGPSVVSVGGQTSSNIAAGVALANAATNANTTSSIVRRDSSGNFSANVITADLVGDVTGNVAGTAVSFTGNLTGDVVSTGMATTLSTVNSNVGQFGGATQVARVTVDAKGRVTAVSQVTIAGVTPAGAAGGDLNGTYPDPGVAQVGGVTAANVAAGATLANDAVSTATADELVKRDAAGSAAFTNVYQATNTATTSATPTFNLSLGLVQKMTIDANLSSITLTNLVAGQLVVFDFVHDATTGGFTLGWPANVFGGQASTGTVANAHNVQMFYSDGTNLYAVGQMRTDLI